MHYLEKKFVKCLIHCDFVKKVFLKGSLAKTFCQNKNLIVIVFLFYSS